MLTIGLVAAFGSALIDNIPFVALMIPVTEKLSETVGSTVLWWTLLAGANLGGNLTPGRRKPGREPHAHSRVAQHSHHSNQ